MSLFRTSCRAMAETSDRSACSPSPKSAEKVPPPNEQPLDDAVQHPTARNADSSRPTALPAELSARRLPVARFGRLRPEAWCRSSRTASTPEKPLWSRWCPNTLGGSETGLTPARRHGCTSLDMAILGRNPAQIIPGWQEFLARHSGFGRPARGVGEPIWADRPAEEVLECQLHEALLNVAVDPEIPFWLMCPYDLDRLGDSVVAEAHRSHPDHHQQGRLLRQSQLRGPSPRRRPVPRRAPADAGTTDRS